MRSRLPLGLAIPALGGLAIVVLPLVGLLQRAPWSDLVHEARSPEVGQALRLSLQCSLGALAVAVVLGVPLAWVLARVPFPGRSLVRALVTLPMVLPPVVGGVALLYAFGRGGLLGRHLGSLPLFPLPFTTRAVVLAESFVAMPFLVVTAEAGLRQMNQRYEEAAATLGAGAWRRFWTVTVPLIAPSLAAGAALSWARALGEFGATITFAGNLPGRTQTMPSAIYVSLESRPEGAIVLSLILLAVSLTVLVAMRGRWLQADESAR
ncbi:MAG: ABC transporter permease [Actinomycetota bacterium]|nr:ABC transporter permease [Actinomycetota bacterium]